METLIRSSSNKVTWELHAIQLVQLVKYVRPSALLGLRAPRRERMGCIPRVLTVRSLLRDRYENACTFTFSGYNNPIRQHLYHCNECDKDVCLVCATHCHTHEECDDPKVGYRTRLTPMPVGRHITLQCVVGVACSQPLKRLGFQDQAVWCACPRHSCLCVPPEEARLYQFLPHPVDTSKVTLGIKVSHERCGSRRCGGARRVVVLTRCGRCWRRELRSRPSSTGDPATPALACRGALAPTSACRGGGRTRSGFAAWRKTRTMHTSWGLVPAAAAC